MLGLKFRGMVMNLNLVVVKILELVKCRLSGGIVFDGLSKV